MEQVERLSRAGQRYESWVTNTADEFTGRMFEAINRMLLDTLAAVARKECDDRLRSQPSHHILAFVTGEIIAVDWARRAVRIKWRTFRMSRPLVQIAFIAISMLSGVDTARAASPNSAAIIADTKRGLVALECPKSSNGLLRVTALVYLPDNPSAPSYSRTELLPV